MTLLLSVAVALLAGLLMTRVFKVLHWNFPDVTAFLIAGVLVGPYCLGRLGVPGLGFNTGEDVSNVSVISNVALGFIAFDIGNEFRLAQLKETGRQALIIGIAQSVFAAIVVDVVLILMSRILGEQVLPMPVAITLGAIASATAPAATLMVVRQYKAKGPLTDLLLPIVALDDAVGLVVFAISFGVAQAMNGGVMDVFSVVIDPLVEIVLSLGLGALMGVLLTQVEKWFYSNSNRLSMTIAFVMLTIALSSLQFDIGRVHVQFSSLLVCMMLGTIFCNLSEYSVDIMARSSRWTAPLYAVFFVISGASLDLSVFRHPLIILVGVMYILSRSAGKYFGAKVSAKATHCPPQVVKYLGITLLPQAGVALGMVVSAQALGSEMGALIRNITLFGVLIYELIGPMMTKWALGKAGEIAPARSEAENRERFEKKDKIVHSHG